MTPENYPPVIVLIEDDETQAELVELAIAEAGLRVELQNIRDGMTGLEKLRHWIGAVQDATRRPALVLLDIKLPRMSGIEILAALQGDSLPVPFPIIMLTSSKIPDDLISSFGNGAVSYFVKPLGFRELVNLMDTIGRRWLDTANSVGS